ncbi:TetR family transcriptional regulator [Nitrogeniibacter mangrovi]|uniref:TetR family transcriptional regulator n=1 Tax=Nitrogeniibacter mangrovi TaxID=2016596 RepID=A0A6C1B112_9RHOO|nr:TetR/AcrR family transcriptional regulator [Nitrogeniibacter mangrovi]QID16595.1 TetR family transcriptional regulator [Nitrogeniibacter mangrovi]
MTTDTPVARRRGRPPKRIEAHVDTRDALVRAGLAVLTEKGFVATGIDEVLRQVGVPKGSFYHYFESKEAFGRAVIDAYADYFARKLDRAFDAATLTPLARLGAFVDDAAAGMARHGFRRGCLIGNLGQEMVNLPESFREQLQAVFRDWEARLAACLAAAREAGEIPPETDCTRMACSFWIGWEGAVLRAKLERSDAPLFLYADTFLAALRRRDHS